jgi:hypothetical protein
MLLTPVINVGYIILVIILIIVLYYNLTMFSINDATKNSDIYSEKVAEYNGRKIINDTVIQSDTKIILTLGTRTYQGYNPDRKFVNYEISCFVT